MTDDANGRDRRRHARLTISKQVRAVAGKELRVGVTLDISASGAALELEADFDEEERVELDIEDLSPLSGTVARSYDDGFAVEFDLDEGDEDRLVAEIMIIHTSILLEDE